MESGMSGEIRLFVFSILAGMLLFFIYDIQRAFRKAIHHKNVWVAAEDFIYWLFAALFLFYLFYRFNEGVLRSYVILGSGLGIGMYSLLLRRFFYRPVLQIFLVFQKILYSFGKWRRKRKKFFVKVCIFPLKKLQKTITIILRHD
jgi:spore cortex biosynthesis protein YabQ